MAIANPEVEFHMPGFINECVEMLNEHFCKYATNPVGSKKLNGALPPDAGIKPPPASSKIQSVGVTPAPSFLTSLTTKRPGSSTSDARSAPSLARAPFSSEVPSPPWTCSTTSVSGEMAALTDLEREIRWNRT